MITDNFGREVTDHGNGVFSVEGVTIDTDGKTLEDALHTFNAMAPEGYQNPEPVVDNAQQAVRQSAIDKLTNLGLTEEEVLAIISNL
jgi:hypothetical protein